MQTANFLVMNCLFCNTADTKVIDSRILEEGRKVRRRRKCISCSKRFTTFEIVEVNMPMVLKNDGRRESYKREKLFRGLKIATQKLHNISTEQINHIIDNIEKTILEVSDSEIQSKDIGDLVMNYLLHLDPVAFIRFASVYRTFDGINEFIDKLTDDIDNQIPIPSILKRKNIPNIAEELS